MVIEPGRPPEVMSFTGTGGGGELRLSIDAEAAPGIERFPGLDPVSVESAPWRNVVRMAVVLDDPKPLEQAAFTLRWDESDNAETDIYRELASGLLRKERVDVTAPERRSAKRAFWQAFRRLSCLPGNEHLRGAWETPEQRAEDGYKRYVEDCGGLSVRGEKLPGWWDTTPEIRRHWVAAFTTPADRPPTAAVTVISREDLTALARHAEGSLDPRSELAGRVRQLLS
jgi:hypothetical protein